MSWKSEHHRDTLARAAVRLSIHTPGREPRRDGAVLLFDATDAHGEGVVMAIEESSWNSLLSEFGGDALAELEELALTGGWEGQGDDRVWRVNLI